MLIVSRPAAWQTLASHSQMLPTRAMKIGKILTHHEATSMETSFCAHITQILGTIKDHLQLDLRAADGWLRQRHLSGMRNEKGPDSAYGCPSKTPV